MKCPKCTEGNLGKIKFKAGEKIAYSCDFCDALWFDHERILETTGHSLSSYLTGMEYEELDEQDEDHRPAHLVRNL